MISGYYPNMRSAVLAWAKPTKVFILGKRVYDYESKESFYENNVRVFRIPTGQKLEMKMEGQRAWNTETVYSDCALDLKVDDIIIFDCLHGQRYRILNKTDWAEYGFFEYHLTSDYT